MPEYVQNTRTGLVHRRNGGCNEAGRPPLRHLPGPLINLEIASIEAGSFGGPSARVCPNCERIERRR